MSTDSPTERPAAWPSDQPPLGGRSAGTATEAPAGEALGDGARSKHAAPERGQQAGEQTMGVSRPARVERSAGSPTTVLPPDRRVPRPIPPGGETRSTPAPGRPRRARLAVQRLDPWSVFLFSLLAAVCLGIALLVAVTALYAVLSSLGVLSSVNTLIAELTGGAGTDPATAPPLITLSRVLGATAVLAAIDVVLLTALATLGAVLYNACSMLTGGVEVVLGERE